MKSKFVVGAAILADKILNRDDGTSLGVSKSNMAKRWLATTILGFGLMHSMSAQNSSTPSAGLPNDLQGLSSATEMTLDSPPEPILQTNDLTFDAGQEIVGPATNAINVNLPGLQGLERVDNTLITDGGGSFDPNASSQHDGQAHELAVTSRFFSEEGIAEGGRRASYGDASVSFFGYDENADGILQEREVDAIQVSNTVENTGYSSDAQRNDWGGFDVYTSTSPDGVYAGGFDDALKSITQDAHLDSPNLMPTETPKADTPDAGQTQPPVKQVKAPKGLGM